MKKRFLLPQVAAMLALSAPQAVGTSGASAAPHGKTKPHGKASRVHATAPGTRLFATGAVDPATSCVKAISADNRFTWVRLTPLTVIVQGGRRIAPEGIGEGDKLLCRGAWVDDAWGPVFQAKRVEVLGRVSDAGLQEKVAAACQGAAQSDATGSGDSGFSHADTRGSQARQGDALIDYMDAVQDDQAAWHQASNALWDQVEKAASFGADQQFRGDFERTRHDYDAALDRLGSISPVPPAMSKANNLLQQSCSAYRQWASLVDQDYLRVAVGGDNQYLQRSRIKKADEGGELWKQALAEIGRVADDYSH